MAHIQWCLASNYTCTNCIWIYLAAVWRCTCCQLAAADCTASAVTALQSSAALNKLHLATELHTTVHVADLTAQQLRILLRSAALKLRYGQATNFAASHQSRHTVKATKGMHLQNAPGRIYWSNMAVCIPSRIFPCKWQHVSGAVNSLVANSI